MIVIKNNNDKQVKKIIDNRITSFNRKHCKWFSDKSSLNKDEYAEEEYNFIVYDDNKVIGGAIGFIKYNWYFLELLYVEKEYRNQDIGTKLIRALEEYSKKENLTGIRMETWNFQAKGFYEKMGYTVWAEIKDCPPGTIDYHLKKELK